ncbi:hypothetical protein SAMD00023353_3700100 [Rosellinia necatrix]|uniref:Uncharacterized protein n=1 Tax=Rosellinia necatrix TaxID=77044 RepID=A0A1S8A930_ROSNE|nr:hypothetical protein SAMD00023353_3700100 [Rosellinia necatrix]
MFFQPSHHPSFPHPTSIQAATCQSVAVQQPTIQNPRSNMVPYFSDEVGRNDSEGFRVPLRVTTNQFPSITPLDTTPTTSIATMQRGGFPHAEQVQEEDEEDTEMQCDDYPSTALPNSTTVDPSKGLAASMWNPARSVPKAGSQALQNSSSVMKVEVVTSGLVQGPGLKASR